MRDIKQLENCYFFTFFRSNSAGMTNTRSFTNLFSEELLYIALILSSYSKKTPTSKVGEELRLVIG